MDNSVLITGAGTGLGLETALYLAERGFTVYATIPELAQRDHVEEQAAHRGVELRVLQLDVTDAASIAAAVRAVVDQCGGIYGLINNAGISLRGYFEDCQDVEIRRTLEINFFGTLAVTRMVLPYMRQARRGRLLFISSVGARIASMARTAYCASKFAVEGFAEALMQEVVPLGLWVSIIEPAIVRTERWTVHRGLARQALNQDSPYYDWFRREEEMADKLVQSSPTTPTDVARVIHKALAARRPRLRYVAGWRAGLVLALRRYLPGDLFERIYFDQVVRRVTQFQPASREAESMETAVGDVRSTQGN